MKSHTEYMKLLIRSQVDYINITSRVEGALLDSGIQEGLCLVNSMHLSSSVFIHFGPAELPADQQKSLELMLYLGPAKPEPPRGPQMPGIEDDMDPIDKRRSLGREVVIAVTRGRLDLGQMEQIFYGEFDGGREKRVLIKIIGE
jgi:secondary thiamine-phosphate synthase enzyme